MPITVYINDSLSISSNKLISDSNVNVDNKINIFQAKELSPEKSRQYDKGNPYSDKRETKFEPLAIQFSTNYAQEFNKENKNICAIQNVNETKYNQISIEEDSYENVNQMPFLQEFDNLSLDNDSDEAKMDLSLNFSLCTAKNMSLSTESSSPPIPLKFKGYSLKQLNDEIESGNIKVFSNVANTPTMHPLYSKQKKIVSLKYKNIPLPSNDILKTVLKTEKSTDVLYFNTTQENTVKQIKTDGDCRYPQANEIMLENTSFLTSAKLSDDTVIFNSSKTDLTQINDFENISDESSINKGASKLKPEKMCTPVFQNHIPESTQTLRKGKDSKSIMSLNDIMDISCYPRQSPVVQSKEFKKRSTQTTFLKNDNVVSALIEAELPESAKIRQTLMYHSEKNNQEKIKNVLKFKNDSTKTDHKIPLETEFMTIGQQNNKIEDCGMNEKSLVRVKLNIPLDAELITTDENPLKLTLNSIDENVEAEKINKEIFSLNSFRKTCDYSTEITLQDISVEKKKNNHEADENVANSNCKKTTRKTLYLNSEISSDRTFPQNLNGGRKTLFFNKGNCELEETLQSIDKRVLQSGKCSHIAQYTDVALNAVECPNETENPSHKNKEQLMDLTLNDLDTETLDSIKTDAYKANGRKSIYTPEFMNLTLDEKQLNINTNLFTEIQTVNIILDSEKLSEQLFNHVSNAAKYKNCDPNSKLEHGNLMDGAVKTLLHKEDSNEMPNEHSFSPAKPLIALNRQFDTYAVVETSKLSNKQPKPFKTPMKSSGDVKNYGSVLMTPRLSLLEFTALEKKISEEEHIQSAIDLIPFKTEAINERLSANLTPAFRMPKRRQTLIFDEYIQDESSILNSIDSSLKKITNSKENASDLEQNIIEKESEYVNKSSALDNATNISGIVPDYSLKETHSCIQIPISKEEKSVSPRAKSSSNPYKNVKLEMDCNVLSESIQIVRRATTSKKRKKKFTDEHGSDTVKTQIYDSNPIIISGVSEFEAQGQHVIPLKEMPLNLNETDKSMFFSKDNPRNDLHKRCISVTLEDIDKTRLSLVGLSYEDSSVLAKKHNANENSSPSYNEVISRNVENIDLKGKKDNDSCVNYLRDISQACRKCKRCQETILNETTSSSFESFALPGLSSLPELDLDRLRRLRRRPTIADVNVSWQRVSLDRTIINVLNRSKYDCQISVFDGAEDQPSPVTKCLRKYKDDMMRYEMHFLEKPQNKASAEKLPIVMRLYNILSANQSAWIFDCQMQYRGILILTHKKILTFTLILTFDEIDPLGHKISLKSVTQGKSNVPIKNWKPIDFILDFQLKLNLSFNLQRLCKGNDEDEIFKILQEINRVCLDTFKMGNCLQRISYANSASIIRDECRTYVRKIIRKPVQTPDSNFKYVEKVEIKVELLNLKKLSFKNIISPRLHQFHEEIHLLPTGLQFLQEFLKSPLNYLKG